MSKNIDKIKSKYILWRWALLIPFSLLVLPIFSLTIAIHKIGEFVDYIGRSMCDIITSVSVPLYNWSKKKR